MTTGERPLVQYQSFPELPGDSCTIEKAKALRLPELSGKLFLDVGCNEGFFCGFASFQGAASSLGIDHSPVFIGRARRRFPQCEFRCQDWQDLPAGQFDVVLLASALHYAEDQAGLIHELMKRVAYTGVLVLELGISPVLRSDWIHVKRGIDERVFPTFAKLKEVLAGYAWKWMGPSVMQDGDPVPRHVIHVSHRRPVAYLLMQPPAHGKSSIARHLFVPAGVEIVSGDRELQLLGNGDAADQSALAEAARAMYSPFALDRVIEQLFEQGLGEELVRHWASVATDGDFVLDAYVPVARHRLVRRVLSDLGYLPIALDWDRSDMGLLPSADGDGLVDDFHRWLAEPAREELGQAAAQERLAAGCIDDITWDKHAIRVSGWAFTDNQELPKRLSVTWGGHHIPVKSYGLALRPDVQAHFKLAHARVGFQLKLDISGLSGTPKGWPRIEVEGDHSKAMDIGGSIDRQWKRR